MAKGLQWKRLLERSARLTLLRQPCLALDAAEPASCPPRARRLALAASILASSMIFIDSSVVTVALPTMARDLGASVKDAQWILNAYVLMLAAFTLVGGAAADRFGRRRVFLIGTAAFALTSIACAAAQSIELLAGARVLQGLAGALLAPASLAVIGSIYPDDQRGRAVGLWAGASSLATAAGPALGGLIVDHAHWSFIFLLNAPIAAAAIVLAWRSLPESRVGDAGDPLDWPGALLAAAGFGGLAWALVALGHRGASRGAVLASTLAGAAGLGGFLLRETRARAPMMPLDLFRSRAFAGVTALTALLYAALSATFFLLPFVLIDARGWSAAQAGVALAPFAVTVGLLSSLAGRASDRLGPRGLLVGGSLLAALGFAALGFWRPVEASSRLGVFLPMGVLGLGFAAAIAPLTSLALASAPAEREGAASGVNNAAARTAGLVGAAIAAGVAPQAGGGAALEAAFRVVMIGAAGAAAGAAAIAALTAPPSPRFPSSL
jgi:EmrB/QacA subfamily drug resistance transporter